ncbi:SDR family oxidoreductase [Chelatococcus sp. GCM10030263]|uniref:SDR family oxidoreductase n=1 Tax=Chelatococcus sp. GCM10030263 TaxID=3273387 RepID=UPI003620777E
MRVMVIGATGLIGSAVTARLLAAGHDVVGIARGIADASRRFPKARWLSLDIARMSKPQLWTAHLTGLDAVVNCAGILQDAPGESAKGLHADAVAALAAACETAGVRRLVHLSAIGADREAMSDFSRSKGDGERAVMAHDLDWVILRPSVVVGRQAYGGSALFRGLAGLPLMPMMPGTGPLQIVQLDDVVATVLFFLAPEAPARLTLELAGPERLTFAEVVQAYRRWLGWREAATVRLPAWVAAALFRLGDFAGLLGWRPPMRSTAQREIGRGAVGDPRPWTDVTGLVPQSLESALAAEPAGVQERWFAALYFLKPLVFTVFSLFWIVTGLLSVGPGYEIGVSLMREGGAGALSGPSVIAGGLADLLIGIGIAFRRTARPALYAALAISLFYAAAGTAILPRLWIDPLGPMVKIWPIIVLNLAAFALLRDR